MMSHDDDDDDDDDDDLVSRYKGMPFSIEGIYERVPFSMEDIRKEYLEGTRKGYLSCQKW